MNLMSMSVSEGPFLACVSGTASPEAVRRICDTWRSAWREARRVAPPLIVTDDAVRFVALGGCSSPPAAPAGWDTLENVR